MPLRNIDGQYIPSFFSIILETNDKINVAIEANPATFAHEFVHYLQDLILPYNIRLNLSKIRWFYDISEIACRKGYLKRPFEEWNRDSQLLKLQYQYTIGDGKFIDQVADIGEPLISSEEFCAFDESFTRKQRKSTIYKYSIPIDNMSENYNIGARDLLEYIAHKIERKHFPANSAVSQFPYESVDILFEKYGLSRLPVATRLCIAEYCLYNDNPIRFMFQQFLKNDSMRAFFSSDDLDPKEIYQLLLLSGFQTTDGIAESLLHKTNRRLEQFKTDLQTGYGRFPQIVEWVSEVSKFAKDRLSNRFIFTDLFHMSTPELHNFMKETISTVGIPLVMNKKGEYISFPNTQSQEERTTQEFIQFYILENFLLFIEDRKANSCPIRKFCHCNYTVDCNGGYLFDREKRIKKNDACPFWNFLNAYKLSDIQYR